MNERVIAKQTPRISIIDRGLRAVVHRALSSLPEGRIDIIEAKKTCSFGEAAASLSAQIKIRDSRLYRALGFGGSIGAAEAYANGWWNTDDLTAVIRIMARNRSTTSRLEGWLTSLTWLAHRVNLLAKQNAKGQSQRNISAHYDLGNKFFSTFLDKTMTYSCAIFPSTDSSLEDASRHKLNKICERLELSPSDELLEIGSGWGSLAIHAATNYDCRVVTTTISCQQFDYIKELIQQLGLQDRITVLKNDYRDLPTHLGRQFNKVVSVEMIEAVGDQYLSQYFQVCNAMTKPGGRMLLQSIIIADELYESYRGSVDMIQRYIFPGGFLPSLEDIQSRLAQQTSFNVENSWDISEHYPRTLRLWRAAFIEHWPQLRTAGYSEWLLRMWDYYFCYCEGGFLEQSVGDVQLLLQKRIS
tara:strand:+ start:253 stop:1494 length:1242 start_codon:yes stop_codon:yes gene_type:complete